MAGDSLITVVERRIVDQLIDFARLPNSTKPQENEQSECQKKFFLLVSK
jgi:hypothetical protein